MIKPYFRSEADAPPPLRRTVQRRVRFEEVDALGIVWHGRYASYIEDGRVAVCEACGIGYLTLYEQGILTPIKALHIDYRHPLRFGQTFSIEGILHYTEAARINYEGIVRDESGRVCASGYSIQLMLDADFTLQLTHPPFYRDFLHRWRAGHITEP
jgi:acyl-CoA thioester hydrolase